MAAVEEGRGAKFVATPGSWTLKLSGRRVVDDALRDLRRLGIKHRVTRYAVKRRFFTESVEATVELTVPDGMELSLRFWG